ncbi:hypothetical protein D6833_01550, partial [Candidatus Parcubacteria bacterium]
MIEILNQPLFAIGSNEITPAKLISAALVLGIGWWASRRLRHLIKEILAPRFGILPSTAFALGAVGFYLGVAMTLALAFAALGFDLGSLALIAGALSVGIGFGLQN